MGWLRRHDPSLAATRRAVRVTLAVCVGFYTARYGLGRPVVATYAAFGAIALGALSSLVGTPAQRTATLAWALPTGIVLITLGTLLCVSPASGVLGMFVVGCAVAFVGVLGPTVAGVANGPPAALHPPVDPALRPRVPGASGSPGSPSVCVLLGLADRFVLPDPGPRRTGTAWPTPPTPAADYLEAAAAEARARVLRSRPRGSRPCLRRDLARHPARAAASCAAGRSGPCGPTNPSAVAAGGPAGVRFAPGPGHGRRRPAPAGDADRRLPAGRTARAPPRPP